MTGRGPRAGRARARLPEAARRNQAYWDGYADTYQADHGEQLRGELV